MAFVTPVSVLPRASARPAGSPICKSARRASQHQQRVRMALGTHVGEDTSGEDYVTLGVAKCFRRVESSLKELLILEPIPASALDCVARLGVPTSYMRLWATRLGDIPESIAEMPDGLIAEGEQVVFAEAFTERAQASARTYKRSPEAQELVPLGDVTSEVNFSIAEKRLVEDDWEPDFSDNVKQDISIDVYDRDVEATNTVKDLYNA